MSGSRVLTNASIVSSGMPEIISDGLLFSATESGFCAPFFYKRRLFNYELFNLNYILNFSKSSVKRFHKVVFCDISLIFYYLKFRKCNVLYAKIVVQVILYAPLDCGGSIPLIHKAFRGSICIIFDRMKSNAIFGDIGQTIRIPQFPHFQSFMYQQF